MRLKSSYSVDELMAVWINQVGKCALTGIPLIAGETAALDHILPVARGGDSSIGNMRFIHTGVNRMKWDSTDEEFRRLVIEVVPNLLEWSKMTVDIPK